jgi:hypothetical protein
MTWTKTGLVGMHELPILIMSGIDPIGSPLSLLAHIPGSPFGTSQCKLLGSSSKSTHKGCYNSVWASWASAAFWIRNYSSHLISSIVSRTPNGGKSFYLCTRLPRLSTRPSHPRFRFTFSCVRLRINPRVFHLS